MGVFKRCCGVGRLIVGLVQLLIAGCAITEILMARYQLFSVTAYVPLPFWPWYMTLGDQCAYGTSMTPCNYLYALGAVSLFFNVCIALIGLIALCAKSSKCVFVTDLVLSCLNWGWWLAGAIYFTVVYHQVKDNPDAPSSANNWRKAAFAVAWAAFILCNISIAGSFLAFTEARKYKAAKKAGKDHPVDAEAQNAGYAGPPATAA